MINQIFNFIKTRYKIIIAAVVIIIFAVFFISRSQPSQPDQNFEHPQYRDITKTLEVSGRVDAKHRARLRFLAGGEVVYLGFQEGDWINKWQTIATIDQRDLQKRLERSLNLYMQQRWDWEDLQDEIKDEALNTSELRYVDKQQWTLDNTVIDVEIQDIAISQSVMSAPFSGILVHQPINTPHVQVTGNDYFEIVNPQSLVFKAEINEGDIALITLNQPARIILDAFLDEEISTKVNYISYVSTQSVGDNVFIVEFPLAEEGLMDNSLSNQNLGQNLLNKYRLGMSGDALIELETKTNVLTIPLIATKYRDGKVYVDIKTNDDQIEERRIEVGLETDEYAEVISGLSETDLVLIPSAF
jgi:multidrug efflux pump subunit AcrA (membrane-fusion protein)